MTQSPTEALREALAQIDAELTQYLEGMPADETSRRLRDVARAALSHPPQPSGWRDIASAPRNGEPVLLFARHIDAEASTRVVGHYLEQYGWIAASYVGQGIAKLVPSLWQPLPQFPGHADEQQEGDYYAIHKLDLLHIMSAAIGAPYSSVEDGAERLRLKTIRKLGEQQEGGGALSADALRRLGSWLRSDDTGISSETLAAIALGADSGEFDTPHDPSDFGRCYRLVQTVPEIKAAFPRVAELVPAFAGILREWDALVAIYLRDLPTGRSDELYARIKTLCAVDAAMTEGNCDAQ